MHLENVLRIRSRLVFCGYMDSSTPSCGVLASSCLFRPQPWVFVLSFTVSFLTTKFSQCFWIVRLSFFLLSPFWIYRGDSIVFSSKRYFELNFFYFFEDVCSVVAKRKSVSKFKVRPHPPFPSFRTRVFMEQIHVLHTSILLVEFFSLRKIFFSFNFVWPDVFDYLSLNLFLVVNVCALSVYFVASLRYLMWKKIMSHIDFSMNLLFFK